MCLGQVAQFEGQRLLLPWNKGLKCPTMHDTAKCAGINAGGVAASESWGRGPAPRKANHRKGWPELTQAKFSFEQNSVLPTMEISFRTRRPSFSVFSVGAIHFAFGSVLAITKQQGSEVSRTKDCETTWYWYVWNPLVLRVCSGFLVKRTLNQTCWGFLALCIKNQITDRGPCYPRPCWGCLWRGYY